MCDPRRRWGAKANGPYFKGVVCIQKFLDWLLDRCLSSDYLFMVWTLKHGAKMKKFGGFEMGVILSLSGVCFLLLGLIFSSGGSPSLSFIQNIDHRSIVLSEGEFVPEEREYYPSPFGGTHSSVSKPSYVKGRVAIPLKYPLSISVLLILSGTGLIVLGKKDK